MCLFQPLPCVFPLGSVEPPRFIKKLEPSRIVKQDEYTRYECKIGGSPEIRVLWYKNETEIQESSKFRMSFLDSVAVLEMHNLSVEDSGDYTCEARNAAGSASSSTSLKVKGQILLFLWVFHISLLSSCPRNTIYLTFHQCLKNLKGHSRKLKLMFFLWWNEKPVLTCNYMLTEYILIFLCFLT